jgi:hypothetical protein
MNPYSYAYINFDKGTKNIQWKKRQPLQQMLLEKLDICMQNTESRSMFVNLYNYQLKVDQGPVKIRPKILKLVQEKARNTLELIDRGNDSLNRTQMAQQLRERIDKWDYMKLKSFHNKRNSL